MRRCAKLAQGDPQALKLSNEIARHVVSPDLSSAHSF
jgi:hypothetical protein